MKLASIFKKVIRAAKCASYGFRDGDYRSVQITYPDLGHLLSGKVILITGGSSGIGYAIAAKCVQCGANVLITGRNKEKLDQAVLKIGREHCHGFVWDISSIDDIDQHLDDCFSRYGKISVLVNNAGVPPTKFWGNVDEEEWEKIYSTNVKGQFFLTQALVKRWEQIPSHENRKIINVSSQGGFVGATYPYRMAKWDIRGFTEGLGKSLIKKGIIVNGIAPGVVRTSMQTFALQQGDNLYTNQNPISRVILPEEIAELALFLISDASNAIVGQTIVCDGGYTLK